MVARVFLIIASVIGVAALSLSYVAPAPRIALAQDSDDLLATVEALQTQVADQDERIAKLEKDLKQLETVLAMVIVGDNPDASDTPDTSAQDAHTIAGSLQLLAGDGSFSDKNFVALGTNNGDFCSGTGGFDDLDGYLNVVISDGSGNIIATESTSSGEYQKYPEACSFEFTIDDVPDTDFYEIKIGRRGGPTYSREELEAANWRIDLSIGQ